MTRRRLPPEFELEIDALDARGNGVGRDPYGGRTTIRPASVGARLLARPAGRGHARRVAQIRPGADPATPACPVFGVCGGCQLQESGLAAQRAAKWAVVQRETGALPEGAVDHGIRGTDAAYGYRNKLELSFGGRRYLREAEHAAGWPIEGRFLGLHAPERFDRVVDVVRCHLGGDGIAAALAAVRPAVLRAELPPPWDPKFHTGFWRHLVLRESRATGEVLAWLVTAPADDAAAAAVAEVAAALCAAPGVVGVVWSENDGLADVARGPVRQTWGRATIVERIGPVAVELGVDTFLQTSTGGAEVLYTAIGELLGRGGTLLDLYCGVGSIGLYLADRFDAVVGVEEVLASCAAAERNAARNGVGHATWHAGKMEALLPVLAAGVGASVVVDPPRAGLHPKVAEALAALPARELVYVACNPTSLGRDRPILEAGGWRPTDRLAVDLFPQTGHVEAAMRFVRSGA